MQFEYVRLRCKHKVPFLPSHYLLPRQVMRQYCCNAVFWPIKSWGLCTVLLLDWNILWFIFTGFLFTFCEGRLQIAQYRWNFSRTAFFTAYFWACSDQNFLWKWKELNLDHFRYVLFYYRVLYLCSVSTINQILSFSAFVDYYDESTADEMSRPYWHPTDRAWRTLCRI